MASKKSKTNERPITVKIDRALASAWKKNLAVLTSAEIHEAEAWDRKYETVGAILDHDPPLYLAGGISTETDFFKRYLPGEDVRSILRNVRVAQYASPNEERAYTTSKLDAAIEYLEATHGRPAKGRIPVDFAKLRIAGAGKDGAKKFADATVAEVRAAARVAKRGSGKGGDAKGASPVVKEIARCLPTSAKDVTVHYADGRVTLGRIPVRIFGEVLRALAKAKVPLKM